MNRLSRNENDNENFIEANLKDWANASITSTKDSSAQARRLRSPFAYALLLALLVHAVLFVLMTDLLRLRSTHLPTEQVIQLRLIDEATAELDPPPVMNEIPAVREPMPVPVAAQRVASESVAESASRPAQASAATAEAQPAPVIKNPEPSRAITEKLFRRDGSVILPDLDASRVTSDFDSRTKVTPFAKNPMNHPSPLPYRPTMFEKNWAPLDETPLGALVRKATVSKSWDTEGGTRISCTSFLFFGACGWGPAPRMPIEELKKMRANPPMPRPLPSDEP